MTTEKKPEISVVICTRNPRGDLMGRVLDALRGQTLDVARYELVLVDNGSTPALDASVLDGGRGLPLRVIREERAGLTVARCAGIAAAQAELLAFVDDDNFLERDYLEEAVRIAAREADVGHFGGISQAELEKPVSWTKGKLLGHLGVRDHGAEAITSKKTEWGPWEPIGAGMVSRREVARKWVEMVSTIPEARLLGRAGKALLSGEDALFARAANALGYACSYQPGLKLTHYMKRGRLKWWYFCKILEGHGRSFVLLRRALGEKPKAITRMQLIMRLKYRVKKEGRLGLATWFWDVGYWAQASAPTPMTENIDGAGREGSSVAAA
ncbi:MAG TPA: glycosyltransferase [Tepidisphaeraceae bacterium]|nr:glycosyltransferase [Tepidisphaeraceae bacterium]